MMNDATSLAISFPFDFDIWEYRFYAKFLPSISVSSPLYSESVSFGVRVPNIDDDFSLDLDTDSFFFVCYMIS